MRTGTVLLAGENGEGRAGVDVPLGGVPDVEDLAGRVVDGLRADLAAQELVGEANVGKGAARHHLIVTATGTVGVEVLPVDAALHQVTGGGRADRDVAGGRDVIGGDEVAGEEQDVRVFDLVLRRGVELHAREEGRVVDVGRALVPRIELVSGRLQAVPLRGAAGDGAVDLLEHLRQHAGLDGLSDLLLRGPDVPA